MSPHRWTTRQPLTLFVTPDMGGQARITDPEGDATVAHPLNGG